MKVHKMKVPLCLVCLCILTIAFYSFSRHIITNSSSSSSSSSMLLTGRRSMMETRLSSPNYSVGYSGFKVADEETREVEVQEDSVSPKYTIRSEESDQPVYNIDYHGVTTHPTPTPKHPRP